MVVGYGATPCFYGQGGGAIPPPGSAWGYFGGGVGYWVLMALGLAGRGIVAYEEKLYMAGIYSTFRGLKFEQIGLIHSEELLG